MLLNVDVLFFRRPGEVNAITCPLRFLIRESYTAHLRMFSMGIMSLV